MGLLDNLKKAGCNLKFKAMENEDTLWFIGGVTASILSFIWTNKAAFKFKDILEEHNQLLKEQETAADMADNGETDKEYPEEERKRDRAGVYIKTGLKTAKVYALPVATGLIALVCFGKGQNVLRDRYASLAAGYLLKLKENKRLKEKIDEKCGEGTADKMLAPSKEDTVVEMNGDGEIVRLTPDDIYESFTMFFGPSNPNWSKSPTANRTWLEHKRRFLQTHYLEGRGYLLLNEALSCLNMPLVDEGWDYGWKWYNDPVEMAKYGGSNLVSFGLEHIVDEAGRRFAEGYEPTYLCHFNVDPIPIKGRIGFEKILTRAPILGAKS